MRTTVVLSKTDVKAAKSLGINISGVCRRALFHEIARVREEIKKEMEGSRASS